ncbi:hypothetical protein ECEC1868_2966, partial [Escherichia coli EC1868]
LSALRWHARGRQPQAPAAILLNSRFTANRFARYGNSHTE